LFTNTGSTNLTRRVQSGYDQLIGDEYFFSVYGVQLRGSKVNDTSFAAIKRFTDLKALTHITTKVTDAGLVHLKGLTKLQALDIHNT
jgi:hypothetical protein